MSYDTENSLSYSIQSQSGDKSSSTQPRVPKISEDLTPRHNDISGQTQQEEIELEGERTVPINIKNPGIMSKTSGGGFNLPSGLSNFQSFRTSKKRRINSNQFLKQSLGQVSKETIDQIKKQVDIQMPEWSQNVIRNINEINSSLNRQYNKQSSQRSQGMPSLNKVGSPSSNLYSKSTMIPFSPNDLNKNSLYAEDMENGRQMVEAFDSDDRLKPVRIQEGGPPNLGSEVFKKDKNSIRAKKQELLAKFKIPSEIQKNIDKYNFLGNSSENETDQLIEEISKQFQRIPGIKKEDKLNESLKVNKIGEMKSFIRVEVKQFKRRHSGCGKLCPHLLRFYKRLTQAMKEKFLGGGLNGVGGKVYPMNVVTIDKMMF